MANVGFLRGLQTSIDSILTNQKNNNFNNNIVEGAFYLTSDTNRLYIGKKDGNNNILASLNAGIVTIGTFQELQNITAEQGVFYYVTDINVLCVRSGDNWVQINSVVTNQSVDTSISSVTNGVEVITKVTDSNGNSKEDKYSIAGANGISVSANGTDGIKVEADTIEVNTAEETNSVTISFDSSLMEANKNAFKIEGGDNTTVEIDDNSGNIKISSVDTDTKVQSVSTSAEATGFKIKVTDSENVTKEGDFAPQISFGNTTKTTVDFKNGVADLDVYSAGQVDAILEEKVDSFESKLKAFNAMEYRGKIETGSDLPTSEVKIGYAYLVAGDEFKYPVDSDNKYSAGTLVIARSSSEVEDENGYIAAGNIVWDFVTGATADTTYKFVATESGIKLENSQNQSVGTFGVEAGTDINVNFNNSTGPNQVVTVNHKSYSTTTSENSAEAMGAVTEYDIVAVDSITTENGHITAVNTKTYKVKDTNASLDSNVAVISTAADGQVNVANTVKLMGADGSTSSEKTSNFTIGSANDNLQVTANGNTGVSFNLVWGEF